MDIVYTSQITGCTIINDNSLKLLYNDGERYLPIHVSETRTSVKWCIYSLETDSRLFHNLVDNQRKGKDADAPVPIVDGKMD